MNTNDLYTSLTRGTTALQVEALVLEVLVGVDTIYLTLIGVPSPFPQDSEHSVKTRVDAPHGTGAQWVRDNFGIEPRIIEG